MCRAAEAIYKARLEWIERFTPIFMRYYGEIADSREKVRLDYRSELHERSMETVLKENFRRDTLLGFTSHGVHHDDIELMLGDELMRKTGSQRAAAPFFLTFCSGLNSQTSQVVVAIQT